ncbi:helix-turn-helix transcriptional regulator [Lacticaseibacillus pabuli]|uniref:Helix-turn-helix transcriptional regulator n=1 Tax=Lacticaseibacillus pabuli TaxID=3025672 RepID=A0ABY7WUU2_9LACO|nr:helix-turn-helix transcriptional regulator [Lacticaseibacillus sp. KACC 23028]WDF82824.1 helix-turn-helix transcriptional regulator [Lacticaseibacillus sp. KACC 23028]
MQISEQIRHLRQEQHLTQQDLATKLHISRQSISKWENDTALPTFDNVVALSDLFDVPLDKLLRDDPELMASLSQPTRHSPWEVIYPAIILTLGFIGFLQLYGRSHASLSTLTDWLINAGQLIMMPVALLVARSKWWRRIDTRLKLAFWIGMGLIWLAAAVEFASGFFAGFHPAH